MIVESVLKKARFNDPSLVCYIAAEEDCIYGVGDESSAFQWRSGFVRNYLNVGDKIGRSAVKVSNLVQIFLVVFLSVLSHYVVDTFWKNEQSTSWFCKARCTD